jgi:hypothetical protein
LENSGSWNQDDIKSIDSALAAAISDKNLNNVVVQYFKGHDNMTSTFKGSQVLSGRYPKKFFKDDVESLMSNLFSHKKLDSYDLNNTVFNFILPSGTMLNDGEKHRRRIKDNTRHKENLIRMINKQQWRKTNLIHLASLVDLIVRFIF